MIDIWWEASGHVVVTHWPDNNMVATTRTVLFEAGDDRSVAFAEALYTLALRPIEDAEGRITAAMSSVHSLRPRRELPSTYYMGMLKEHFEEKGNANCAFELSEYARHDVPEIREIAIEFLQDVVDTVSTVPNHPKTHLIRQWFIEEAPQGEPFDAMRAALAEPQ